MILPITSASCGDVLFSPPAPLSEPNKATALNTLWGLSPCDCCCSLSLSRQRTKELSDCRFAGLQVCRFETLLLLILDSRGRFRRVTHRCSPSQVHWSGLDATHADSVVNQCPSSCCRQPSLNLMGSMTSTQHGTPPSDRAGPFFFFFILVQSANTAVDYEVHDYAGQTQKTAKVAENTSRSTHDHDLHVIRDFPRALKCWI